jgi:hypothetical protein
VKRFERFAASTEARATLVRNGKVGFVIELFGLQIDQGMAWLWSLALNVVRVYEHVYLLFWTSGSPVYMATRKRRCHPLMKASASAVAYASGSVDVRWRFLCFHQAVEVCKVKIKLKTSREVK